MDTPESPFFPDNLDRMTILERAQQLYDETLRQHAARLDQHAEHLGWQAASIRRHEVWHQEHLERMDRMAVQRRMDRQEHERRMAHLEDLIERQQQMQQAILEILRHLDGR